MGKPAFWGDPCPVSSLPLGSQFIYNAVPYFIVHIDPECIMFKAYPYGLRHCVPRECDLLVIPVLLPPIEVH